MSQNCVTVTDLNPKWVLCNPYSWSTYTTNNWDSSFSVEINNLEVEKHMKSKTKHLGKTKAKVVKKK